MVRHILNKSDQELREELDAKFQSHAIQISVNDIISELQRRELRIERQEAGRVAKRNTAIAMASFLISFIAVVVAAVK